MYSELETYVRRYYDDWLRCSRRWCSMNGIPQEAYDLLADVLESLCRKSDALLSDMLSHENNGDKKLFYYVRKALRYTILNYRLRQYHPCKTLALLSGVQHGNTGQVVRYISDRRGQITGRRFYRPRTAI